MVVFCRTPLGRFAGTNRCGDGLNPSVAARLLCHLQCPHIENTRDIVDISPYSGGIFDIIPVLYDFRHYYVWISIWWIVKQNLCFNLTQLSCCASIWFQTWICMNCNMMNWQTKSMLQFDPTVVLCLPTSLSLLVSQALFMPHMISIGRKMSKFKC